MEVEKITDVDTYKKLVEQLLLEKEACNNLILGIIQRLMESEQSVEVEPPLLGVVKEGSEVVYCFVQTPPHNLILGDITGVKRETFQAIASFVQQENMNPPGVLGPREYVEIFKDDWVKLTGSNASIHMRQLIYQLDSVNPVDYGSGELVKATDADKGLIANWLRLFGEETNEAILKEQAETLAERFVTNQSVYLWIVDGEPVSMVNQSRKTKHGTTINGVYTPNEHKRKGYATAAVAALSQKLLEHGFQFCSLYTDLDNPTSNSIYQKIGYRVVGESIVYQLEKQ